MKDHRIYVSGLVVLVIVVLAASFPLSKAAAGNEEESQLVVSSSLLAGLAPGAVFPFIDTTPHSISMAHIAVTDSTSNCSPGAAAPSNVKVLVGNAGAHPPVLVSVMGASANLGISTTSGQCVFHATIKAGQNGVPSTVTDIVVLNGGSAALTGLNSVTATATVRLGEVSDDSHHHGNNDGGSSN
ncbi:MAG: hypothetical protein JO356_07385 [Acidobacteria bacterium]|nr:hypothetical protein [Acidobacteriota bacterium]